MKLFTGLRGRARLQALREHRRWALLQAFDYYLRGLTTYQYVRARRVKLQEVM